MFISPLYIMLKSLKKWFKKVESKLTTRIVLFVLMSCLVYSCQLAGLTSLMDEIAGDRDALKTRISYWATVCTIAYSLLVYVIGRWFTKDLYWHWNVGTDIWAATPSLTSGTMGLGIGNKTGGIFGLVMLCIFVVSTGLNTWTTRMTTLLPTTTVGNFMLYNLSTIYQVGSEDNYIYRSSGFREYYKFVEQTSMGYVDKRELAYYNGLHYWTPLLISENATTVLVKDLISVGIDVKCGLVGKNEIRVVWNRTSLEHDVNIGPHNISVGNFGREKYWKILETTNSELPAIVYVVFSRIKPVMGPPTGVYASTSSDKLIHLYVVNCTIGTSIWNVTGSVNSYKVVRSEIANGVEQPEHDSKIWSQRHVNAIVDGLNFYTEETFENTSGDNGSPLWNWWSGNPNNITAPNWATDRLLKMIAYTLTETSSAVSKYNITARALSDTSIISVNKTGIIGSVIFQAMLTIALLAIYICYNKPGIYHSDDVDYLLEITKQEYIKTDEESQVMLLDDM